MSLGPAPLFWLRPRLLVSYRAIRVESGRQRLYFRSASFHTSVHLALMSLVAAPRATSARPALLHEGTRLSRARSRRRSPLCLATRSASSRPVAVPLPPFALAHTCNPHPGASQGGTRVESGRRRLYSRVALLLVRVHLFLMSISLWDGRAVALVLGCGFAVFLRAAFVILLVSRAARGRSSASRAEHHHYPGVSNEDEFFDAKEIFVAPPFYTFPVEKSEVADAVVIVENK
ncbi:hypothetical protein C8J57DRAFT_1680236 [Mycena rebaudengoi]|nr:hypothetical protein C8J57DRAFT_1680236 [Mycena rebaudengoi]